MSFFPILLSLSFSIQRLCLCQPDSTNNSCSLQKKCHRFSSNLDIILYNPLKKFADYFATTNTNQMEQSYDFAADNQFPHELFFEVFGSSDTNGKNKSPIQIDLSERFFSNIEKLTIYGGEFNQMIRISNQNNRSISLEAKNIKIIYENEQEISFSTLRLQHSFLAASKDLFSNSQKLIVTANKVIGDSYSLTSSSFSLIKTYSIEVTDKKTDKCKSCNEFGITAPIELLTNDKKRLSLEDEVAEASAEEYQTISYCVSTKNRLKRAQDQLECNAYSVPLANYVTGQDKDFIQKVQDVPNNTVLRFYITLSSESDAISINFGQFVHNNITLYFRATSLDESTRVEIKGSQIQNVEDKNLTLYISKLKYFSVQSQFLSSTNNVIIQQTPIYITDPTTTTPIYNLNSDSLSLSYFSNTVFSIQKRLTLSKATSINLPQVRIKLQENCMLYIDQFSSFPITRYNIRTEAPLYYLSLSDIDEEKLLNIYFEGSITVFYADNSLTSSALPKLTFSSGTTITALPQTFPYLNITIIVPEQGLSTNFGTGSTKEFPFPASTVFTFNAANDPNLFSKLPENIEPLVLNLTISDFGDPKDNYRIVLYRNFYLNLMNPQTFSSYTVGVNEKLGAKIDECKEVYNGELPYFVWYNETDNNKSRCYSIAGYDLARVNGDVQDSLHKITFDETAILLDLDNVQAKFPDISNVLFITTNSTKEVIVSMTDITTADSFHHLTLLINSDSQFTFDDTFNNQEKMFISPSMRKLKLLHGTNPITLSSTAVTAVPLCELDNPVINVTYNTPDLSDDNNITSIKKDTFNGKTNTRIGPVINVTLEENDVVFPQNAFLGTSVSFTKGAGSKMTFVYCDESVSNYSFSNIELSFISLSQWNQAGAVFLDESTSSASSGNGVVNVKANSIDLQGSTIKQGTPINAEVNDLTSDDIGSALPASSFASPIKINNKAAVQPKPNDPIKQIIYGDDTVQVITNSGKSVVLQQNNPETAQMEIKTDQTQPITLSVAPGSKTVPNNMDLNLSGDAITLNYDKSWNNVAIPSTFKAITKESAKVTINAETLNAPNVVIQGANTRNIVTSTHTQKYTNTLGFIIFIAICGAVLVISIILCIVGLTCCRYRELYDVSTDVEDDDDIPKQDENDIIIEEEETDESTTPQRQDDSPEFPEDYYENPTKTYPKFDIKNNDYVMDNPPRALRPQKDTTDKNASSPLAPQQKSQNELLKPAEKEPNRVISDDDSNSDVELDSLSDKKPAAILPPVARKLSESDSSSSEEPNTKAEATPERSPSKVQFADKPIQEPLIQESSDYNHSDSENESTHGQSDKEQPKHEDNESYSDS